MACLTWLTEIWWLSKNPSLPKPSSSWYVQFDPAISVILWDWGMGSFKTNPTRLGGVDRILRGFFCFISWVIYFDMAESLSGLIWPLYCWWKKSCTTWDVKNPVNHGIFTISAGALFHPSTVYSKDGCLKKNVGWSHRCLGFPWKQRPPMAIDPKCNETALSSCNFPVKKSTAVLFFFVLSSRRKGSGILMWA